MEKADVSASPSDDTIIKTIAKKKIMRCEIKKQVSKELTY